MSDIYHIRRRLLRIFPLLFILDTISVLAMPVVQWMQLKQDPKKLTIFDRVYLGANEIKIL